jgi:hypothetical protein
MPVGFQLLIAFAVGGLLGLLLGWLLGRRRTSAPDSRFENDLQQRLAQREAELNQTRGELVQIKTSLATAQANQSSAEKLLVEQRALHDRAMREAKEA